MLLGKGSNYLHLYLVSCCFFYHANHGDVEAVLTAAYTAKPVMWAPASGSTNLRREPSSIVMLELGVEVTFINCCKLGLLPSCCSV